MGNISKVWMCHSYSYSYAQFEDKKHKLGWAWRAGWKKKLSDVFCTLLLKSFNCSFSFKIPLAPMGVIAPRVCTLNRGRSSPIDTSGHFWCKCLQRNAPPNHWRLEVLIKEDIFTPKYIIARPGWLYIQTKKNM